MLLAWLKEFAGVLVLTVGVTAVTPTVRVTPNLFIFAYFANFAGNSPSKVWHLAKMRYFDF
jgi:hypothetical protein